MARVGARRPFKWCEDQNGIDVNEGVPIAKNKSKVHGTKSSNKEYDKPCQQERHADRSSLLNIGVKIHPTKSIRTRIPKQ